MPTADLQKQPHEVSAMFDAVARRYDRTNGVLSVGNSALWRHAVVTAIDPQPGERILDIAAGTGTSSAALAKRGSTVIAADFSDGMLDVGRRRHPHLEFVHADAMALPFDDNEFDVVTISFGLRNIVDPKVAIAEMLRVLKPGGRLLICEFSTPPMPVVRKFYSAYLATVMPIAAKIASSNPDAYTYLAESIEDWPDQRTLSSWLRKAGFTDVAYRNLTAGIVALHRGTKPAAASDAAASEQASGRAASDQAASEQASDRASGAAASGASSPAASDPSAG